MSRIGKFIINLLDNIPQRVLSVMASWVFVMNGDFDGFKDRIKCGQWPIYSKTHHRNEVRSGDDVIFYLAGKPNKKIIGKAVLSSNLTSDGSEYSLSISNIEIWKQPIPMKELVASLGFIKNKSNWGMHLQGGIIPLPRDDYEKILFHSGNKTGRR